MRWFLDLLDKKSFIFIGGGITSVYFFVIVIFCLYFVDITNDLKLNEFGDLLAGVFAPLAFLWMVITILIQGKELELQRNELSLQREELAKTSEQLARQGDLMETQIHEESKQSNLATIASQMFGFDQKLMRIKVLVRQELEKLNENPGFPHSGNYQLDVHRAFLSRIAPHLKIIVDENTNEIRSQYSVLIKYGEELKENARDFGLFYQLEKCGFVHYFEQLKNLNNEDLDSEKI